MRWVRTQIPRSLDTQSSRFPEICHQSIKEMKELLLLVCGLLVVSVGSIDPLQKALVSIFGSNASAAVTASAAVGSYARRRCSGYLACEYHVPVVELRHVAFKDGVVVIQSERDEVGQQSIPHPSTCTD